MKLFQPLAVFMAAAGFASATNTETDDTRSLKERGVDCTLFSVAIMNMGYGDTDEKDREVTHCVDNSDVSYTVSNLPKSLLKNRSGSTLIHVDADAINGYDIDLNEGSVAILSVMEEKQGRPLPYQGAFTAAVIRITGNDGFAPGNSAAVMADEVFGINTDTFNLVSGYGECSGEKTTFSPCEGMGLVNGVLDITIADDVSGVSSFTIQNAVTTYLPTIGFDRTRCTNVLYAMPTQVSMGIAYGYYNGYLTVYKSPWESRPSTQMHELGHNFNFRHSGVGASEYADKTCMMGYSYSQDEGPRMCFNAAKSWYFGWYDDRHITVNTNLITEGKMISIDDYLNGYDDDTAAGDDQYTIAHVYGSSTESYYFMFNRKEGINAGVVQDGDKVVIINQNLSTGQSDRVASLSTGQQFTKFNFGGGTSTLVIKVCNIVFETEPSIDYAHVIVDVNEDGEVDCGDTTKRPTGSPDSNPASSPTSSPTSCDDKGDCFRLVEAETGISIGLPNEYNPDDYILEGCDNVGQPNCVRKLPCKKGQQCQREKYCNSGSCYRWVSCARKCVRHVKSDIGYSRVLSEEAGFTFRKCPHDPLCLQKRPCIPSQNVKCETLEKCVSPQGQCIEELPCPEDCSPTPSPQADKTPAPTSCDDNECLREVKTEIGIKSMMLTFFVSGSYSRESCKDIDQPDCFRKKPCVQGGTEVCYLDKDCEFEDCIKFVPCNECLREAKVNIGIRPFTVDFDSDAYIREKCDDIDQPTCFRKKPCVIGGEKCWLDQLCQSDNRECLEYVPCLNECVRHENVKVGYELVPASESGFTYNSECPHDPTCLEKIPCVPSSTVKCLQFESCESTESRQCIKEIPCSKPCSPTQSPTKAPTKTPTQEETPSPTSCSENDCFERVQAKTGVMPVTTTDFGTNTYRSESCQDIDKPNCTRKKPCIKGQVCYRDEECTDGECIVWLPCFDECIRRKKVKTGFTVVETEGPGFTYGKSCPHDKACIEKKPCRPNDLLKCSTLVRCEANQGEQCFVEIPCPSPCSPTQSPTKSPEVEKTPQPTNSPTKAPTRSPGKYICEGCTFLEAIGKVQKAGNKQCIKLMKVAFTGTNGKCNNADCVAETKCSYKWSVKYELKKCKPKKFKCKLVAFDVPKIGTISAAPQINKITLTKGSFTANTVKQVECKCDTHQKRFQVQCHKKNGDFFASHMIKVDYSCSECETFLEPTF